MKKLFLFLVLILFSAQSFAQYASVWDQVPSKIKARKSFKRLEWFYRQRAYPLDTIPLTEYFNEKEKQISFDKRSLSKTAATVSWAAIGPRSITGGQPFIWGNVSGRIRGLAVHPIDPNIVYIGAAGGGIWKTTNGGITWNDLSSQFELLTFGAIAIDPQNPETVYAGTGELLAGWDMNTYSGDGIYKSTDGGNTWAKINQGIGNSTHIAALAVSPGNSNIILAALASGNWFKGDMSNEGIWRSTDAGATWTRVKALQDPNDIVFHPTDPNRVYFSCGGGYTTAGVYASTNGGVNWIQTNTGLPATSSIRRIQIAIAASTPSTLFSYIYTDQTDLTSKAYKSTDNGSNWTQISSTKNLGGSYDGSTWDDQGWYDLTLAVKPTDAKYVLFGNIEFHKTTDGSTINVVRNVSGPFSGTTAWDSPMHVDYHKIVFAPSNSNYVYVACDGGIYKSTNGGTSWTSVNNLLSTLQFYRIASHPTNESILLGGAQDNGVFRTTNKGTSSWNFVTTGDGMECFYDYTNPNIVYYSTQQGSLEKSTDGGVSNWSNITPTWDATSAWTTPFAMHVTDHTILYTASKSFWKSTNSGSAWTNISPNAASKTIVSFEQSKVNANYFIFAAGEYSTSPQVKVSTDGGITWTDRTSKIPTPTNYISRVVTDPTNVNTVYFVRSGFGAGKVFRSTDLGNSWTNISGNLPDVPCSDLFIDPVNTAYMYVANDFGVYYTANSGTSWSRLGNGMPYVPVLDFSYFNNGTKRLLRAATHGRSAFEINLNDILTAISTEGNSTITPTQFSLEQNYPNPFNPATIIKFSVPQKSFVSLKVFDVLGKEVQTLVDEEKSEGTYEVTFDAAKLSSGIYFYILQTDNFLSTKKMIVLK
ncbi:MAG: T9SS type A sorting domain-containing protein [Ignavibacteria bacterium]|nr:T9SS type A sorting domain-containing protein [Ignavibacteria bacterium]